LVIAVGFIAIITFCYGLYFLADWLWSISDVSGRTVYLVVIGLGGVLFFGAVYVSVAWHDRRRIGISVASDRLTVDQRPGDVYDFNDAKLGTWGVTGGVSMGTTLHLHCGPSRFVLGGRDHRVGAGTRLEAPDAGYGMPVDVDAWLPASEFDEILSMVGRRSAVEVRPPAPEELTRCLLFPNPLLIQEMGSFAFRKQQEFLQSLAHPSLIIDVGGDELRVMNPNGTVMASVSLARVTATPIGYRARPSFVPWIPTREEVLSKIFRRPLYKEPEVVVLVPGLEPMTIGVMAGSGHRPWRGDVPEHHEPADYVVSEADFLMLVQKLGLARA
jgi:hypothetical protein